MPAEECPERAQAIGNEWTQSSLRLVLVIGMAMAIPPGVLSFFFSDKKALGAVSEGLLANPDLQQAVAGAPLEHRASERCQQGACGVLRLGQGCEVGHLGTSGAQRQHVGLLQRISDAGQVVASQVACGAFGCCMPGCRYCLIIRVWWQQHTQVTCWAGREQQAKGLKHALQHRRPARALPVYASSQRPCCAGLAVEQRAF